MVNQEEHADHLRTIKHDATVISFFSGLVEDYGVRSAAQILVALDEHAEVADRLRSVYFVRRASDGAVKIGFSEDIVTRIARIGLDEKCAVEMLAVTPGGVHLETMLHHRFHDDRISGEWFRESPALIAEIDRIKNGPEKRRQSLSTALTTNAMECENG